jgi:signal transduction histidine kinase
MYLAVIAVVGLVLLAVLATTVDLGRLRADWPLIAILGTVVVVGHAFSVPLSGDGRGPRVHVDAPFAFALVLFGGVGVAALLHAGSCVLHDVAHHKPARKAAFNVGCHTIGIAGGAGVWMALGGGRAASVATLPAILVGTAVFVAIKALLVTVAIGLDEHASLEIGAARMLRLAAAVTLMAQAVVLVIVLAAGQTPLLLLALGLPTVAGYVLLRGEARASIGRSQAEHSARRETQRRLHEHELLLQQEELARRLQETDRMKDDLLAMVSHELRTPLTTVVGALRLLSTGAALSPEERQEMLEMADRQARRLRGLIEQLLLAAQSDRGGDGYPSSATELVDADTVELVLEAAHEARAGHRDHPIRVHCDGSLPVRVAPDAVLQIIGNLLDNACKYSPGGRPVWLVAERDTATAVVAVEDDGAGVPPAERERVFERFTRFGTGRGLGLGLYIARQLARAQGGDLVLTDARQAGGARFELRLPLRERAAALSPGGGQRTQPP